MFCNVVINLTFANVNGIWFFKTWLWDQPSLTFLLVPLAQRSRRMMKSTGDMGL